MVVIALLAIVLVVLFIILGHKDNKAPRKSIQTSSPEMNNRAMMDIAKKIGQNGHGNYWKGFKARKPQDAKAIDALCGRDMDALSDADAFQIVSSFLRWSKNSGEPIAELKDNFINQMQSLIADGATYDMLIDRMKVEKSKEAKQFNVSEDFTICSFMYEWLVEMKNESYKDSITEKIAQSLNIPDEQMDSFKEEMRKKEEELNLAPDISQLDREENKLFALANNGVNSLIELSTLDSDDKTYRLNENGKFEARILCSTMVMNLHSHFKNEIDLDIQADRYFLLLADSITGDYPDDEIDFINSRIAFYNELVKIIKGEQNSTETDSIFAKAFYFLYLNPLSDSFENDNIKEKITKGAILALKFEIEDVLKEMEIGRLITTSESAQEVKQKFLLALQNMIPESKKGLIKQDMAWLLADQAIDMIKSGLIDDKIASVLPYNVVEQFEDLIEIYRGNSELSNEQIENVLDNTKNEYIQTFSK